MNREAKGHRPSKLPPGSWTRGLQSSEQCLLSPDHLNELTQQAVRQNVPSKPRISWDQGTQGAQGAKRSCLYSGHLPSTRMQRPLSLLRVLLQ